MDKMLFRIILIMLIILLISCFSSNKIKGMFFESLKEGNFEEAKQLLKKGADINAKYTDGISALEWFSFKNNFETVKFLVDNSADINAKDNHGLTALYWAVDNDNLAIAKLLVENGGDVNAKNKDNNSVLMLATANKHFDIAKLLIDNGADSNYSNSKEEKIQINEIPMYGGDKITEYQSKINQNFINEIKEKSIAEKKELKDLNDGSKYFMKKGWEALHNKDYSTAIKRFNQAWLLDPNNPDVYWGFGIYLGKKEDFEESIKMFYKYLDLDPNNVSVMEDLARSYNMNGFKKSDEGKKELLEQNLIKANEIVEKALKIKQTSGLYYRWAVGLFYLNKYKEAKEKVNKAIELGEKIPQEFIKMIDSKLNQ